MQSEKMRSPKWVTFLYKNYKGETAVRRVYPLELWWGKTDWHPAEQWFLKAFDIDKEDTRDFAISDISGWTPILKKDE
jgi:predicted DNA-binding transcriptional regulator YafY